MSYVTTRGFSNSHSRSTLDNRYSGGAHCRSDLATRKAFENFGPEISEKNDERKKHMKIKGNKHMKTITKFIYAAFAVVTLAMGALTANGASGDLFVSINSTGENGAGSINQYRPDGLLKRIAASGLSEPRGMAFSRSGNLFVANTTFDDPSQTFQGTIVKITPDGVQSLVAT